MDLIIASYLIILTAGIVFRLGRRFGAQRPELAGFGIGCGIILTVWLAWSAGSNFYWASYFPHGSVILLSNVFVIASVGSAGLMVGSHCFANSRFPRVKETLAASGLCISAMWFLGYGVLRPHLSPIDLPAVSNWRDGVCLQSHNSSCAAAAAATLLRQHRLYSTERKMARACLTSEEGTLPLGTYRGLWQATSQVDLQPRAIIYDRGTPDTFPLRDKLPLLAHVSFGSDGSNRRGLQRDREGHCVVLLDTLSEDRWLVADPAVGRVIWTDQHLRRVWTGEAIYLQAL